MLLQFKLEDEKNSNDFNNLLLPTCFRIGRMVYMRVDATTTMAWKTECGKHIVATEPLQRKEHTLIIGGSAFRVRRLREIRPESDGSYTIRPYNTAITLRAQPSPGGPTQLKSVKASTVFFNRCHQDFRETSVICTPSTSVLWSKSVDLGGSIVFLTCEQSQEDEKLSFHSGTIGPDRAVLTLPITFPTEMCEVGKSTTSLRTLDDKGTTTAALTTTHVFHTFVLYGYLYLVRRCVGGVLVDQFNLTPTTGALSLCPQRRYKNSRNPFTPNDDKDVVDSVDTSGQLFFVATTFLPLEGLNEETLHFEIFTRSGIFGDGSMFELALIYDHSELGLVVARRCVDRVTGVTLYAGRVPDGDKLLKVCKVDRMEKLAHFTASGIECSEESDSTTRTCARSDSPFVVSCLWQGDGSRGAGSWLLSLSVVTTNISTGALESTGPPPQQDVDGAARDILDVLRPEEENRLRFAANDGESRAIILDITSAVSQYDSTPRFVEHVSTTHGVTAICVKGDLGTAMCRATLDHSFRKPRASLAASYAMIQESGVHSRLGGGTVVFSEMEEETPPCKVRMTVTSAAGTKWSYGLTYPYPFSLAIEPKQQAINERALIDGINQTGLVEILLDQDSYEPGITPQVGVRDLVKAGSLTFLSPQTGEMDEDIATEDTKWSALHVDMTPIQSHPNAYAKNRFPATPSLAAATLTYPEPDGGSFGKEGGIGLGEEDITASVWIKSNPKAYIDTTTSIVPRTLPPDTLCLSMDVVAVDGSIQSAPPHHVSANITEASASCDKMMATDHTLKACSYSTTHVESHPPINEDVFLRFDGKSIDAQGTLTIGDNADDTTVRATLQSKLDSSNTAVGGSARVVNTGRPYVMFRNYTINDMLSTTGEYLEVPYDASIHESYDELTDIALGLDRHVTYICVFGERGVVQFHYNTDIFSQSWHMFITHLSIGDRVSTDKSHFLVHHTLKANGPIRLDEKFNLNTQNELAKIEIPSNADDQWYVDNECHIAFPGLGYGLKGTADQVAHALNSDWSNAEMHFRMWETVVKTVEYRTFDSSTGLHDAMDTHNSDGAFEYTCIKDNDTSSSGSCYVYYQSRTNSAGVAETLDFESVEASCTHCFLKAYTGFAQDNGKVSYYTQPHSELANSIGANGSAGASGGFYFFFWNRFVPADVRIMPYVNEEWAVVSCVNGGVLTAVDGSTIVVSARDEQSDAQLWRIDFDGYVRNKSCDQSLVATAASVNTQATVTMAPKADGQADLQTWYVVNAEETNDSIKYLELRASSGGLVLDANHDGAGTFVQMWLFSKNNGVVQTWTVDYVEPAEDVCRPFVLQSHLGNQKLSLCVHDGLLNESSHSLILWEDTPRYYRWVLEPAGYLVSKITTNVDDQWVMTTDGVGSGAAVFMAKRQSGLEHLQLWDWLDDICALRLRGTDLVLDVYAGAVDGHLQLFASNGGAANQTWRRRYYQDYMRVQDLRVGDAAAGGMIIRVDPKATTFGPIHLPGGIQTVPHHTFELMEDETSFESLAEIRDSAGSLWKLTDCSKVGAMACTAQCLLDSLPTLASTSEQSPSKLTLFFRHHKCKDERSIATYLRVGFTHVGSMWKRASGEEEVSARMVRESLTAAYRDEGGTWWCTDYPLKSLLDGGLTAMDGAKTILNFFEGAIPYVKIENALLVGRFTEEYLDSIEAVHDRAKELGCTAVEVSNDNGKILAGFSSFDTVRARENIWSSDQGKTSYIYNDTERLFAVRSGGGTYDCTVSHVIDRDKSTRTMVLRVDQMIFRLEQGKTGNKTLDKVLSLISLKQDAYSEWFHLAVGRRVPYEWVVNPNRMDVDADVPAVGRSSSLSLHKGNLTVAMTVRWIQDQPHYPLLHISNCVSLYINIAEKLLLFAYYDHPNSTWCYASVPIGPTLDQLQSGVLYDISVRTRLVMKSGGTQIDNVPDQLYEDLPVIKINPNEMPTGMECAEKGKHCMEMGGENYDVDSGPRVDASRRRRMNRNEGSEQDNALLLDFMVSDSVEVVRAGSRHASKIVDIKDIQVKCGSNDERSSLEVKTDKEGKVFVGHVPGVHGCTSRVARLLIYDGSQPNKMLRRLSFNDAELESLSQKGLMSYMVPYSSHHKLQRVPDLSSRGSMYISHSTALAQIIRPESTFISPNDVSVTVNGHGIDVPSLPCEIFSPYTDVKYDPSMDNKVTLGPTFSFLTGPLEICKSTIAPSEIAASMYVRKNSRSMSNLLASIHVVLKKKTVYASIDESLDGERIVVQCTPADIDPSSMDSKIHQLEPVLAGCGYQGRAGSAFPGMCGRLQFSVDIAPSHWESSTVVANTHFAVHDDEMPIYQSVVDATCPVAMGYVVLPADDGTKDMVCIATDLCVRDKRLYIGLGDVKDFFSTEFVSNIQYDAIVDGYIEGAPPVPQSNLLTDGMDRTNDFIDYDGLTAVNLDITTTCTIDSSKDVTRVHDYAGEMSLSGGFDSKCSFGILPMGVGTEMETVKVQVNGGVSSYLGAGSGVSNTGSHQITTTTTESFGSALTGYWPHRSENDVDTFGEHQYRLNNIGHAFVRSRTGDLMLKRSKSTHRVCGYAVSGGDDDSKPREINVISFPIDPNYQKQGCLDGMIGMKSGLNAESVYAEEFVNADGGDASYKKVTKTWQEMNDINDKTRQNQLYDGYVNPEVGNGVGSPMDHSKESYLSLGYDPAATDVNLPVYNADFYVAHVWSVDGGTRSVSCSSNASALVSHNHDIHTCYSLSIGTSSGLKILGPRTELSMNGLYAYTYGQNELNTKLVTREIQMTLSNNMSNSATWLYNAGTKDDEVFPVAPEGEDAYNADLGLSLDGETGFVYQVEGTDGVKRRACRYGTVKQFRTVTFFNQYSTNNLTELKNIVVDKIWLSQARASDTHPGHALAQALDKTESTPWRVKHRVTYVERNLPPTTSDKPNQNKKVAMTIMSPADVTLVSTLLTNRLPSVEVKFEALLSGFELGAAILEQTRVIHAREKLLWVLYDHTMSGYELTADESATKMCNDCFTTAENPGAFLLSSEDSIEIEKTISENCYYTNVSDVMNMTVLDMFPKSSDQVKMLEFTSANASRRRRNRKFKWGHPRAQSEQNSTKQLSEMIKQTWAFAAEKQRGLVLDMIASS